MRVDRSLALHICNRGHPAIPWAKRAASRFWTLAAVVLFVGGPIYWWWWDVSWLWAAGGVVLGSIFGSAARRTAAEFVAETARDNPAFKDAMIRADVLIDDGD